MTTSDREARQEAIRVELEEKYTVGPISAAKIDYTIKWQFPIPHEQVKQLISSGEYFFILTITDSF